MSLVMFRVMVLQLWRDRGALLATLVAPPAVFLLWAATRAGDDSGREPLTSGAAAISVLMAMVAAVRGALTLIDERSNGVADRVLTSVGGPGPVINGKFLFLAAQGLVVAALVFVAALLGYGLPLTSHFLPWLVTASLIACVAGGLALTLAGLCQTRLQAIALSTGVILVLALLGEGVATRLSAAPWVVFLKWATPNAWAVQAFEALVGRGAGAEAAWMAWSVLTVFAVAGVSAAHAVARRGARS